MDMTNSQRDDAARELARALMRILNRELEEPLGSGTERQVERRWRTKIEDTLKQLERKYGD